MTTNRSDFILFKTEDEQISVDVRFEDETVWLTQDQMAQLFDKGRTTITEHIQNVFKEGELKEEVVCRNLRHTTPPLAQICNLCLTKTNSSIFTRQN